MSRLEITATNPEGQTASWTDDHLIQEMIQRGAPIVGMTDDGLHAVTKDPQGNEGTIDIRDYLSQQGWSPTGFKPTNVDTENVNAGWGAAISKLSDDSERQDYLSAKFRRLGHAEPVVVGQGDDWYFFNPQSGQYVAVTNKPGIDTSDITRAGVEAPRFLGALVGGAAGGAAAGPLGAAGGAGLGGGAGDTAARAALAYSDDEFAEAANLGSQAKDVAIGSALDAGTAGLFGGIAKMFPGTQELLKKGVASRAAAGAGRLAEGVGKGVGTVGKGIARNELAADLASGAVPGIAEASMVGWGAQLPQAAARGAAKAPGYIANAVAESNPQLAMQLASTGEKLGRQIGRTSLAEETAARLGGGLYGGAAKAPKPYGARDFMHNAGRMLDEHLATRSAAPGPGAFTDEAATLARHLQEIRGMAPEAAKALAEETLRDVAPKAAAGNTFRNLGKNTGAVIDWMGDTGKALTNVTTKATQGLGYGAWGAGAGTQMAGKTARVAGTLAGPAEAYGAGRYGIAERLDKLRRERLKRQSAIDKLMDRNSMLAGE